MSENSFQSIINRSYNKSTEMDNPAYTWVTPTEQQATPSLTLGLGSLDTKSTQESIDFQNEKKLLRAETENQVLDAYSRGALDSFNLQYGADTALTDIAKSYVGQNRYSYGGFDCSKFVQDVAKRAGYKIPRDTASQLSYFQKTGQFSTNLNSMKPGDIIYMRSGASPSGRHVGIYVGNGLMIDNAGKGKPIRPRPIAGRSIIGYGRVGGPQGDAFEVVRNVTDKKYSTIGGLEPNFLNRIAAANGAMRDAGLGTFSLSSGFRNRKTQARLNKQNPKRYAAPGHSLHEVGLSADINLSKQQHDWLAQNAKNFGLYQPDPGEPWHWQPLG